MPEQQQPIVPVVSVVSVVSEVARLRKQIELEHRACCFALNAPSLGNAQHRFINRRMERIGGYQARLGDLIGEENSIQIVLDVMEDSPPQRREEQGHATAPSRKH